MLDGGPLLRLFDSDDARARERLDALRARLVKFFQWRNGQSPEDLAQETFARGLEKIAEGTTLYTDPEGYFYGIARLLLLEDFRARQREDHHDSLPEDISIPAAASVPSDDTSERELSLRRCLARLTPEQRTLIVEYYTGDHGSLRGRFGLSANALRIRVFRLRHRLESLIREDLEHRGK